jgi:hypothetical protein
MKTKSNKKKIKGTQTPSLSPSTSLCCLRCYAWNHRQFDSSPPQRCHEPSLDQLPPLLLFLLFLHPHPISIVLLVNSGELIVHRLDQCRPKPNWKGRVRPNPFREEHVGPISTQPLFWVDISPTLLGQPQPNQDGLSPHNWVRLIPIYLII